MVIPEAERIARAFLSEHIEPERCTEPPTGLYAFKLSEEILFGFRLPGRSSINYSEDVAVSKKNGEVLYIGFWGDELSTLFVVTTILYIQALPPILKLTLYKRGSND